MYNVKIDFGGLFEITQMGPNRIAIQFYVDGGQFNDYMPRIMQDVQKNNWKKTKDEVIRDPDSFRDIKRYLYEREDV